MKPIRIYIAGPMRGYPEHNFPAFHAAAFQFRCAGFIVENPAEIGLANHGNDPAVPGGQYLRDDVRVITHCDAIALLPGWEASTGARCEVVVAITLGLQFFDATTLERIPAPSRVICNGGYDKPAGLVDTLDSLRDEVTAWANKTFVNAKASSKAEHLRREAVELCDDPTDLSEMADIFILLSHISDGLDLVGAIRAKHEKNKLRRWGVPDAQGVVEHVEVG